MKVFQVQLDKITPHVLPLFSEITTQLEIKRLLLAWHFSRNTLSLNIKVSSIHKDLKSGFWWRHFRNLKLYNVPWKFLLTMHTWCILFGSTANFIGLLLSNHILATHFYILNCWTLRPCSESVFGTTEIESSNSS